MSSSEKNEKKYGGQYVNVFFILYNNLLRTILDIHSRLTSIRFFMRVHGVVFADITTSTFIGMTGFTAIINITLILRKICSSDLSWSRTSSKAVRTWDNSN